MSKSAEEAAEVKKAAQVIQEGGVVAFPTETVYGLGADALNVRAVAKIFEIKNRPTFDPLIVHIADISDLEKLTKAVPEKARALMKKFWPGPLTLILPKSRLVPDLVTSGLSTVGIRMPAHPVALSLIREAKSAIAAPSANPFGALSPTTAEHVRRQLGSAVETILDGGPCAVGVESTIVEVLGSEVILHRPGGISLEEIQAVVGTVRAHGHSKAGEAAVAPGQLESHYAPRARVILFNRPEEIRKAGKMGVLWFKNNPHVGKFANEEVLSVAGDLKEAACNLFACLHRLDALELETIYAERVSDPTGLGRAIADRLTRASKPKGTWNL